MGLGEVFSAHEVAAVAAEADTVGVDEGDDGGGSACEGGVAACGALDAVALGGGLFEAGVLRTGLEGLAQIGVVGLGIEPAFDPQRIELQLGIGGNRGAHGVGLDARSVGYDVAELSAQEGVQEHADDDHDDTVNGDDLPAHGVLR